MTDDVFTRLASTRILSLEGPPPEAVPSPEERSRALGSEAVAAYATDCRPIHEDLRRVIGQLAGLLILAQLTRKPLMAGLPELAQCKARWQDAAHRLGLLQPPPGLGRHKAELDSAHAFLALR